MTTDKSSNGNQGVVATVDMNCYMPITHRVYVREHIHDARSVSFSINSHGLTVDQIWQQLFDWEKAHLKTLLPPMMFLGNQHKKTRTHSIIVIPIDKATQHEKSFSLYYPHYSVTEIGEHVSRFLCGGKVVFKVR